MEQKTYYTSKTFWLNILAVVGIIAQGQFGYVVSPEMQVTALAVINFLLRIATKQEIIWSKPKKDTE